MKTARFQSQDKTPWPVAWTRNSGKPQGVALVATLIMLSLVTFMTVAFLGVARRERRSMEAHLNQGDAQTAMEAGLNMAQTELVNRLLSVDGFGTTDPWGYSLFVSTNFINPAPFNSASASLTNVNDLQAVAGNQASWLRHVANLQYLPRAPVFDVAYTNGNNGVFTSGERSIEGRLGRFFVDHNRNGMFEPTFRRWTSNSTIFQVGDTNWLGIPTVYNSLIGNFVGDPHWIGLLEDPNSRHSSTNRFIARYAFLATPAGKSIDLNHSHNQNKLGNVGRLATYFGNPSFKVDGFVRNQGVGSWEINLAGLLTELNTNYWVYGTYFNDQADPAGFGGGLALAFHHSLGLLQYRWNENFINLTNLVRRYGADPSTRMTAGWADYVGDSVNLDMGTSLGYYPPRVNTSPTNPLTSWPYPWVGSTNGSANDTYRYNSVNDLWSANVSLDNFRNQMTLISSNSPDYSLLTLAGQLSATADHYTWYRMLEQLETESRPRDDRVNLNWDNLNSYISGGITNWDARYGFPDSVTRVTVGTGQTTESFTSWSALRFFTNVAQAIIDASVITNVQIYNTNVPYGQWSLFTNYSIGGPATDVGNTNVYGTNLYTRVSAGQTRFWTNSAWRYLPEGPIPLAQTNGTTEYDTNVYHTLPISNITVFPVNQLTPEVQRLLQVAANLYETAGNAREWLPNSSYPINSQVRHLGVYYRNNSATSPATSPPPGLPWVLDGPGLPAVFRPIFSYNTNSGLFGNPLNSIRISEWVEAGNPSWITNVIYLDVNNPDDRATLLTATVNGTQADYMLKGFPVIIGAKASTRDSSGTAQSGGLPNFNEVSYSLMAEVSRKLQFVKTNYGAIRPDLTNQMFEVGLKAGLGTEVWNSYQSSYPRELDLYLTNYMTVTIQNEAGPIYTNSITNGIVYNVPANTWPTAFPLTNRYAFITPLGGYVNILSNSAYYPSIYSNLVTGVSTNGGFRIINSQVVTPAVFVPTNLFPDVQLKVVFSNWLTYAAVDRYYQRVVDYVNLGNLSGTIDLVTMLLGSSNSVAGTSVRRLSDFFSTNRYAFSNGIGWSRTSDVNYITEGISNQIRISWDANYPFYDWRDFNSSGPNIASRQTFFRRYLGIESGGYRGTNPVDAPFSPTIMAKMDLTFEANDPLVHYSEHQLVSGRTGQDTNFALLTGSQMLSISRAGVNQLPAVMKQLGSRTGLPGTAGALNGAFSPWGGNPEKNTDQAGPVNRLRNFNLAIKDPGIYEPWQWDFPERRFGSLGWMGRVHRGTPWQTIYLKSRVAYPGNWFAWSGAYGTHPTNDWRLFDNLTVAVNKTAASGALSVNQTNMAAWAAILAGVNVVSNSAPTFPFPGMSSDTIRPASAQFRYIHAGIDLQRRLQTSFVRQGDILSVPELSDASPYLSYGVQRYNPAASYVQSDYVVYRGIIYGVVPSTGIPAGIPPPTLRDHLLPVYNVNYFYDKGAYVRFNGQIWYADGAIAVGEVPGDAGNSWFHGWEVYRTDVLMPERYGFTDNMLEKIPQSIMGLLKLEPNPRVAIYSYGQALAPAANSVYLFPGDYQNMVTNYQVIGESASRTVLRVEGIPPPGLIPIHTNLAPAIFPRVVVEDYKVMGDQ